MKKNIRVIIIFFVIILAINSSAIANVGIEDQVTSYLLGDFETGEILESYNIDKPIEIASISKLMSYLITMKNIEKGLISLEEKVYIDKDITRIKGSSLNMEEGESFTVEELLRATLVVSANDATYALAKKVAGTEEAFVNLMNEQARILGLKDTVYYNSTGLPEDGFQNMMSTKDIFTLSKYIIDNYPEVLTITSTPYIELFNREYKKENTNPLLNEMEGIDGLKTGFTNKAGHCLVSTIMIKGDSIRYDDFRLIAIVMGTKGEEKRKELGKQLIQYGLDNYSKRILANKNTPVDIIYMPKSEDKEIEVYPLKNFSIILKDGEYIDDDKLIDDDLKLPLKRLDKVGNLVLTKNGKILEEIDLIVHKDIEKENVIKVFIRQIKDFIQRIFFIK